MVLTLAATRWPAGRCSVQLRAAAARRVPGDARRVPDVRADGGADGAQVGVGPRRRRPRRDGGLLLHLQHHRPLPRRHEVLRRRGRATSSSAVTASPVGLPDYSAAASKLRRVRTAPGVARLGEDCRPRCDRAVDQLAVMTVIDESER